MLSSQLSDHIYLYEIVITAAHEEEANSSRFRTEEGTWIGVHILNLFCYQVFLINSIYMQVLKFCDSSNLTKAFLLSEKLSLLICTVNAKKCLEKLARIAHAKASYFSSGDATLVPKW